MKNHIHFCLAWAAMGPPCSLHKPPWPMWALSALSLCLPWTFPGPISMNKLRTNRKAPLIWPITNPKKYHVRNNDLYVFHTFLYVFHMMLYVF